MQNQNTIDNIVEIRQQVLQQNIGQIDEEKSCNIYQQIIQMDNINEEELVPKEIQKWIDCKIVTQELYKQIIEQLKIVIDLSKKKKIDDIINPDPQNILNFFKMDPVNIKSCIIGQDPYTTVKKIKDEYIQFATGYSFAVDKQVEYDDFPPSLKNIYQSLYADLQKVECIIKDQDIFDNDFYKNSKIKDIFNDKHNKQYYTQQLKEFFSNSNIHEKRDGSLSSWIDQGVLLINSQWTSGDKPKSHSFLQWKDITRQLIINLTQYNKKIVFILLGADAQSFQKIIKTQTQHQVIFAPHPSPINPKHTQMIQDGPFLKSYFVQRILLKTQPVNYWQQ